MPGILLAVLFFSIIIVRCTSQDERGTSVRAGFWAGILLMIVFVISRRHSVKSPNFTLNSLSSLNLEPAGIGLKIGFMFLWVARFLLPTQMVGLISLILSAASTTGLYAYVFVESLSGPSHSEHRRMVPPLSPENEHPGHHLLDEGGSCLGEYVASGSFCAC